jgi:CRISPR-associated protein Cas2
VAAGVKRSEYLVVAYDVASNRRRSRLHRALQAHLPRVQKSVFEGPLARRDLSGLRKAINKAIDQGVDTVRLVRLCPRCRERVERFGTAGIVPLEADDVVIDG